ncbi:cysteinyl leukotriene receptor 1-like [Gigantopelta aegis]|uniref:cysteinyl leukotriene receptor 1-like n=1 Tax=Gigantopelta aegis TaxID=1735272 RepID=UPI001B889F7D|nr:cysteinyl leukotriene receptor 1-like [Gigantopelta aegis]
MTSNITNTSWVTSMNTDLSDFTTATDAQDERVDSRTDYNGTDFDGWPYFHIEGLEYWVIVVIIVIFGLIGNAFSFLLMSDGQFSLLSYPVYLKALAVSDSVQLITKLVEETQMEFGFNEFSNFSDVVCKLWQYVRYSTLMLSPWLVVGLSLDRLVCVLFPMTRDRFCTKKKALVVCSCLALVFAVIMIPVLTSLRVVGGLCGGRQVSDALLALFIVIRLILSSTLPCLLIFILNVAIIVRIRLSATFRKTFTSTSASSSARSNMDSSTRPLVMVSVIAFLTLLPFSITECVQILLSLTLIDIKTLLLTVEMWPLFHLIQMLNFGLNFYILVSSSATYRNIIAAKVKCSDRRPKAPRFRRNPKTSSQMSATTTSSINVATAEIEN